MKRSEKKAHAVFYYPFFFVSLASAIFLSPATYAQSQTIVTGSEVSKEISSLPNDPLEELREQLEILQSSHTTSSPSASSVTAAPKPSDSIQDKERELILREQKVQVQENSLRDKKFLMERKAFEFSVIEKKLQERSQALKKQREELDLEKQTLEAQRRQWKNQDPKNAQKTLAPAPIVEQKKPAEAPKEFERREREFIERSIILDRKENSLVKDENILKLKAQKLKTKITGLRSKISQIRKKIIQEKEKIQAERKQLELREKIGAQKLSKIAVAKSELQLQQDEFVKARAAWESEKKNQSQEIKAVAPSQINKEIAGKEKALVAREKALAKDRTALTQAQQKLDTETKSRVREFEMQKALMDGANRQFESRISQFQKGGSEFIKFQRNWERQRLWREKALADHEMTTEKARTEIMSYIQALRSPTPQTK